MGALSSLKIYVQDVVLFHNPFLSGWIIVAKVTARGCEDKAGALIKGPISRKTVIFFLNVSEILNNIEIKFLYKLPSIRYTYCELALSPQKF